MRSPSTAAAVGRFLAGSLLAIAVVVIGGYFALRSVTMTTPKSSSPDPSSSGGLRPRPLRAIDAAPAPGESMFSVAVAGLEVVGVKRTLNVQELPSMSPPLPGALQSLADYPEAAQVIDAGNGYRVRHLIERSCVAPGVASVGTCTLSPPSVDAALGMPPPGELPRMPYYRVTIRVDGVKGATTFVQATLCAANANPRCAWRVLDE